jgi:dTDP-4-amino-4,6-dideoxygalactose transaminase
MNDNSFRIPMFDAARFHAPLAGELSTAFDEVLRSGRFIGGETVEQFERELADVHGVSRSIGTSSGTDALTAALQAFGVGSGDEVITTPYTFFATAGVIARLGARPVFVDIDPMSFNIDPSLIAAAVTNRTVGILPVHLFGQCADMDGILDNANVPGLWVLEDAAQSIGATWNGRLAGTMGRGGALSFFPAKNLGALGDAGAVITGDHMLADRIAGIRNHGALERYRHEIVGGNFRLDALQAAFLSIKLRHLPRWQDSRKRLAARYREALGNTEQILLPSEMDSATHVYNQFVIRTDRRNLLQRALCEVGIETAVHYPLPLHMQPCFEYLGYKEGDFPNAEHAAKKSLALPMDPLLTEEEQQSVIGAILKSV